MPRINAIHLKEIYIYPVKSCRGIPLSSAQLEPRGLEHDRKWMIVDDQGHFVTQRQVPRMTLIGVELAEESLILCGPGRSSLHVRKSRSTKISVDVWGDACRAYDEGPEASAWLSDFLGFKARLVRQVDDEIRPIGTDIPKQVNTVSFADRYPLLILSEASVEDLNRRLSTPLSHHRFRPNLFVTGCGPHEEDGWKRVRISDIEIEVTKGCARCSITTVDPDTAEAGAEPLKTLATYRKKDGRIYFAQNAYPLRTGRVEVGMNLDVIERKLPLFG